MSKLSSPKKVWKSFITSILKTTNCFFGNPDKNQLHCHRRIHHQEAVNKKGVEVMNYNIVEAEEDDLFAEEERDSKALVLHGMDAKAQEYIDSVRTTWRLEKQNSEREFWDMLARGM